MREVDQEKLERTQELTRMVGRVINSAVQPYGFALLIFSFEGPELSYVSNADRDDMVKVLEEFTANLKSGKESEIK